ncbi:unnamed protein product [Lactuca virosa]|uniref:Uncharacterized protein n=1 Tax=Lactuca virosa TaxID=75947 RepID=A0AAU9NVF6_9ASTR|nr:unnamed protein product [Lactuca virosa]
MFTPFEAELQLQVGSYFKVICWVLGKHGTADGKWCDSLNSLWWLSSQLIQICKWFPFWRESLFKKLLQEVDNVSLKRKHVEESLIALQETAKT